MKNLSKRIALLLAGLLIIGNMVGLFIFLDLGIDPITAMNYGIAMRTGLSLGVVTILVQVFIFVPMVFARRDLIGIGTLIALLGIGYIIEYSALMWGAVITLEFSLAVRILLLFLGMNVVGIAVSLMIIANLGLTAYDGFGFAVEKLTANRVSFRTARVTTDVLFVLAGFLLGAPIGIATLLTMVCVGPIVNYYKDRVTRFIRI